MAVRAALTVSIMLACLLAACGDREAEPTNPGATATAVPAVPPGGVVPWASLPLPAHPVKAAPSTLIPTLAAPRKVAAGDTMVFELTLANRATTPYQPADCPIYVAWLHTASVEPVNIAGEPLTLNCSPALPIPPGGEARFAMEFQIPASAPGGPWFLSWGFASPTGTYGTVATAPVEVTPR